MFRDGTFRALPDRQQRGSRARCILLTHGSNADVARRLAALAAPLAIIDPGRHRWMPRGPAEPKEAKLGDELAFLSDEHREAITSWWLAVRKNANTPNWDIASTATIAGTEGLLLVEAKAHAADNRSDGKDSKGNAENHARIDAACRQASASLNSIVPGWNLSIYSHYQMCNRFAWAWKLASLGIPIILVYLGFICAEEMRDQGIPIADAQHWQHLVREHAKGIVPATVWDAPALIGRTPLHAVIRASEIRLDRS